MFLEKRTLTEEGVQRMLREWAEDNGNIRAVILTGSRGRVPAETDFLSDYDIELLVGDKGPFKKGDGWLDSFGKPLLVWPRIPAASLHPLYLTRLVLFEDRLRIDFQITDRKTGFPLNRQDGFRILHDKEGLFQGKKNMSGAGFGLVKPSAEEYFDLVNVFWWDTQYIPKHLFRDELPFAKTIMEENLHLDYLQTMMNWYIGLLRGWDVDTGKAGSRFRKFLSPEMWTQYAGCFSGLEKDGFRAAFFNTLDLFSKLSRTVGDGLGFTYPLHVEEELREYYQSILKK